MKKVEIIKKKEEFNNIIQTSPFFKNKSFVIYIRKRKEKSTRFGIAISKKTGNAVMRNKLKRRVRTIVDEIKENFSKENDYIIMIKRSCVELSFQEMKSNLIELIEESK